MRGVRTKKIKVNSIFPPYNLADIFERAKIVMGQEGKIPIRMVLLERNENSANLLISFMYVEEK